MNHEIENDEDGYDPAYEEEQQILRERRAAHSSLIKLDPEKIKKLLEADLEERGELIKDLINDEYDALLAPFADHFLPSEDATYSLDENAEIISVEIDEFGIGSAYLQGTCSKHSACRDQEDLGRQVDGDIALRLDIQAALLNLSVENIERRTTLEEF